MFAPRGFSSAAASRSSSGEIIVLLKAWRGGDQQPLDRSLTTIGYDYFRKLARQCLRQERATAARLDKTALVHEACVRLVMPRR